LGASCWGLTGAQGGELSKLCRTIKVPSGRTDRIQEIHGHLGHLICQEIEMRLGFVRSENV